MRKLNTFTNTHLRQLFILTFSFISFIAVIFLIWKIPQLQVSNINDAKDRGTLENEARSTLVQALGGLFFFVTAYFSLQNLKITQENLKLTQQNLIATQEKQVTERFAKAIEQLGNRNIHVRLGAIYALERIAKDSNKDYWQVMEILTAYVRERAPYPPRNKEENLNNQLQNIPAIKTDIQAVLTVISRRVKSYEWGEEYSLNLSKSDLRRGNFSKANLCSAILLNANLCSANLVEVNLSNANLVEVNLSNANLGSVNLSSSNLYNSNLSSVRLYEAYLEGANLSSANLSRANLYNANLRNTNLKEANLKGANFSGVKNLAPEQVKAARNWQEAKYDKEFRAKLGLPTEEDE